MILDEFFPVRIRRPNRTYSRLWLTPAAQC